MFDFLTKLCFERITDLSLFYVFQRDHVVDVSRAPELHTKRERGLQRSLPRTGPWCAACPFRDPDMGARPGAPGVRSRRPEGFAPGGWRAWAGRAGRAGPGGSRDDSRRGGPSAPRQSRG